MDANPTGLRSTKISKDRRITLPQQVLKLLQLRGGETLTVWVLDGVIHMEPGDARSPLPVEQWTDEMALTIDDWDSLREVRRELFREHYPDLAAKHGI